MIYLGADHAGFELKEQIKSYLKKKGLVVRDLGAWTFNKDDDYPDFAIPVAEMAVKTESKGIVVCGSAEGVCIAANKVRGARAVAPRDVQTAIFSRAHNDANVLCLAGGQTVDKSKMGMNFPAAKKIIDAWMKTTFSGEPRHVRRLKKIDRYESR